MCFDVMHEIEYFLFVGVFVVNTVFGNLSNAQIEKWQRKESHRTATQSLDKILFILPIFCFLSLYLILIHLSNSYVQ